MKTIKASDVSNRALFSSAAVRVACSVLVNKYKSGIISSATLKEHFKDLGFDLIEIDVVKMDSSAMLIKRTLDKPIRVQYGDLNFESGNVYAEYVLLDRQALDDLKSKPWYELGNIVLFQGEAISIRDFQAAAKRIA